MPPTLLRYWKRISTSGQLRQICNDNNVLRLVKLVSDTENTSYAGPFHHICDDQCNILL